MAGSSQASCRGNLFSIVSSASEDLSCGARSGLACLALLFAACTPAATPKKPVRTHDPALGGSTTPPAAQASPGSSGAGERRNHRPRCRRHRLRADPDRGARSPADTRSTSTTPDHHPRHHLPGRHEGIAEAGATVTAEVEVPAAGLDFLCSVPGHADAGMKGMITVKGSTGEETRRPRRPTPFNRPSCPTPTPPHTPSSTRKPRLDSMGRRTTSSL